MPKCNYCDKETFFPFTCNYCGRDYCEEHRLPEVHDCYALPKEKWWYGRQKKDADLSEPKFEKPFLSFVKNRQFKSSHRNDSKISRIIGTSKPRNLLLSLKIWFPIFIASIGGLYLAEGKSPTAFYQSFPELARYGLQAFAVVIAMWTGYETFKKCDVRVSSDRGIFGLRLLSAAIAGLAFFLLFMGFTILGIFSFRYYLDKSVLREVTSTFLFVLSLVLLITSAYLTFKFERKSGVIVYSR